MKTCPECGTKHPDVALCPKCYLKRKAMEGQPTFDHICMCCGGTDLAKSEAITESYEEYQGILRSIECENCGATWKAIYRVGGYTALHEPKK